ncbi:unnamed protein product [Didymodactylos carnosus]|uniref:Uncharacterized protein n=1 Tax=Didymodactylos carnosus TaxID=1234261 RepID=A0A814N3E8_9BILA|nr:unnamed protein product [Didymodactylos carnosus]CAF1086189.1 unnamed protein product [Didymodactylos carnosus]CAF3692536.1 unnamed protein product [Didymodactylos carnosus]CAF3851763.1 unnamed protein product [Didymodactylos carnosus]
MNSSTDAALTELNACRKMDVSPRHNHEESADISTELSQSDDGTSRQESNTSSASSRQSTRRRQPNSRYSDFALQSTINTCTKSKEPVPIFKKRIPRNSTHAKSQVDTYPHTNNLLGLVYGGQDEVSQNVYMKILMPSAIHVRKIVDYF